MIKSQVVHYGYALEDITKSTQMPYFKVELVSSERCVERCIEDIQFCFIAQYEKDENEELGTCTLFNETKDAEIHPDATLSPLTIIYELLEKCPPFTASDITHRISKLHREALLEGRESENNMARLADAFFPENRDHVGSDDEFKLEGERYAVMRTIEEVEIQATKNRAELPRDPFNDGPRFHQSSHERERGDDKDRERDREYLKNIDASETEFEKPIRPTILHRGQQSQQMSARPISGGHPCLPNADCARTLYQLDNAPCPARQGDPCAPKKPCMNDDCYHVAPPGASAQTPVPEWTEWTECTASCGISLRTRQCLGGITCLGPSTIPCNVPECSVWALWSPWSLCTATCGVGEIQRNRVCQTGRNCEGPSVNGLLCPGSPTEERMCDKGPCPHWSPWGAWETCSKECGAGHTYRARECINGISCEGASEEKILCNQQPCPEWSQWTAWTVCDEKCGEESIRLRNRKCLNADNNNACDGPAQDQMSCPYRDCPKWEEWGEWADCSTTCGQGTQKRHVCMYSAYFHFIFYSLRKCDSGNACTGPSEEMRFCQVASCPYWGDWSPWSGCSVSCGQGVCERTRKCIIDEFLQLPTLDELERDDSLEKHEAKEALIARAKTISKYRKTNETRLAPFHPLRLEPQLGGTCDGPEVDTKVCDAGPCCVWNRWTEWSPCIGCGRDGITKRNRVCTMEGHSPAPPPISFQDDNRGSYVRPQIEQSPVGPNLLAGLSPIVPVEVHRGKRQVVFGIQATPQCHCPGDDLQTKPCPVANPCQDPISRCEWSEWGEWCGCMRCRPGKEVRRRFCDRASSDRSGPMRPDSTCDCGDGDDSQERACQMNQNCYEGGRYGNSASMQIDQQRQRYRGNTASLNPNYNNRNRYGDERNQPSNSRDDEQYVPIDSVIGRVQLRGKQDPPPYNKKDDAEAFGTTEFPYKVCHWSHWSSWSKCHENSIRERKRFCIGQKDSQLVSNCECIGKPHEEESCNATGFIEQSNEETDSEIESNLDKLLGAEANGEEVEDKKEAKPIVDSGKNSVQCDWTRWSQWSVCTASCGEGRRMRRRRCPCGDTKCGAGSDSDSEICQGGACELGRSERRKPIFSILPSSRPSKR
uniref:Apple domain-containing protein n=1 Tax=Caenorhabditis japonica TaxID=281687 RepID=A0A8R1I6N3_CAEJA